MNVQVTDRLDVDMPPQSLFVEMHWVDTEPETIELGLPTDTADRGSVLVVDDDPQIRNMLEMLLGLEGLDVGSVPDGVSALEALKTKRPDVILLDIMMPVLNGYAIMEHLRDSQIAQPIPVIMISAKAGDEDLWEAWSRGADSYITKPLDLEVLLSEIHRVTSGKFLA